MKSIQLKGGLAWIPIFYKGNTNSSISTQDRGTALLALEQMRAELTTTNDRLANNYTTAGLHLEKMLIYSLVYDQTKKQPVFFSGVQIVSELAVRVFSRYYLFQSYRTNPQDNNLFAKVDDFEALKIEIKHSLPLYPFIFWSRDKGTAFFKRLKRARPDIFAEWQVLPERAEIIYPDNYQGIFYLNKSHHNIKKIIKVDLLPKTYSPE
jgi:hypothetical protein